MYLKVYRHELKYFINYKEYLLLKQLFDVLMERDTHCEDHGYWIRSMYFDSYFQDDYYEKVVGVENRKKVRLRTYNLESKKVKLEIKNKYNDYNLKETIELERYDAEQLALGNSEVLTSYENNTARRVYFFMKKDLLSPKVIIDYEREAYRLPFEDIRITFDKNVRASNQIEAFWNKDLWMKQVFEKNIIVLEIKYNTMLPKWLRDALTLVSSTRQSVSKYCLSRLSIG